MNDLLEQARTGDRAVLGRLLEHYRSYLLLLARVEIGRQLRSKLDASDLVQEAFLEAHRHFDGFRGEEERQFLAWLRSILAGTMANQVRRYLGTQGRDVRLEQQLADSFDRSSMALGAALTCPASSPSQQVARREQGVQIASALAQLAEDYRVVIVLRHLEGLTFPQVAQRMGRSVDSVEKLWLRALGRLRQLMGGQP